MKFPEVTEHLIATGVERLIGRLVVDVTSFGAQVQIPVSRCERCTKRVDRAAAALDAFPRLQRALGSREYALAALDGALIVFDVLGVKRQQIERYLATEADVRLLIELENRRLPSVGSLAVFATRLAPIMRGGADRKSCVRSRWGHLSDADTEPLRQALVALFRARTEVLGPIPVPDDGGLRGCLLCGVGTVEAFPRERADVWGPQRNANPATLGGRGRPEPLSGHLCPPCRSEADTVGALGPTAMERSLVAFLGARLRDDEGLAGVAAWCTLPDGTSPNSTRWAHVKDLAALRSTLSDPEHVPARTRIG